MGDITKEQFAVAVGKLPEDGFTSKGQPKAAAMTAVLEGMELGSLSAKDISALWADYQAGLSVEAGTPDADLAANLAAGADIDASGGEGAPEDGQGNSEVAPRRVTVTEAEGSPIIIYVNGRQDAELWLNVETEISDAAFGVLQDMNNTRFEVAGSEDDTDE